MTGDTVQCANCGQPNPDWAKICRFCAAPLVPAARFDGPPSRIPTDQASLISIGAAVAAILAAVVVGLLIASLDPIEPTVGFTTPSPTPSPTPRPTPTPELDGESPEPTPQLPGTLTFGTDLNEEGLVTNPTSTFPRNSNFAWAVEMGEAWGTTTIYEVVMRIEVDGSESELEQGGDLLDVNPSGRIIGFEVETRNLYDLWGPGDYVMRIYRCTGSSQDTCQELVAENTFTLTD